MIPQQPDYNRLRNFIVIAMLVSLLAGIGVGLIIGELLQW